MSFNTDKFTWREGDIEIIPPKGQASLVARLQAVNSIEELQAILPEVEEWMNQNPQDTTIADLLIEVTNEM